MERIRNALIRFMYGRYGMDALGRFLEYVFLGLVAVRLLLSLLGSRMPGYMALDGLLNLGATALLIAVLYRMLSRNLYQRRAENEKFLALRDSVRTRRQDRTHSYIRCTACGTMCRVPKGLGHIELTCPKCGNKMRVKS